MQCCRTARVYSIIENIIISNNGSMWARSVRYSAYSYKIVMTSVITATPSIDEDATFMLQLKVQWREFAEPPSLELCKLVRVQDGHMRSARCVLTN